MYNSNDITYPLISWYKLYKRDLPWRRDFNHANTPYNILVSEFNHEHQVCINGLEIKCKNMVRDKTLYNRL